MKNSDKIKSVPAGYYWMKNRGCLNDQIVERIVEIIDVERSFERGHNRTWTPAGRYVTWNSNFDTPECFDNGLWNEFDIQPVNQPIWN